MSFRPCDLIRAQYLHGHTVGGTNPSLVESLGTGTAIIAHDNRYNRWVAGDGARYFHAADDLATLIGTLEAGTRSSDCNGGGESRPA